MSVLNRKRRTSSMEYVTNGYTIENGALDFIKRLSTKNARIYQPTVTRLAMLQADLAYMANEIFPTNRAEYQLRRLLLSLSQSVLHALDKRMADVYDVLMVNPSEAFNRQNGKPIPKAEAVRILDKMAESLGNCIDEQDALIKGVREADKKRFSRLPNADPELTSVLADTAKSLSTSLLGIFL